MQAKNVLLFGLLLVSAMTLVELCSLTLSWPFLEGFFKERYGVRPLPVPTEFMLRYSFYLWGIIALPIFGFFSLRSDKKIIGWLITGITFFLLWVFMWISVLAFLAPFMRIID